MKETKRRKPAEHGTQNGYNNHRYHGEAPCDDCRRAHTEYTKAQQRAFRRLREAFTEEYKLLLREELDK